MPIALKPDGELLRAARHAQGWTQQDLGERLGVPQTYVARWEGRRRLTAATRERLGSVLRVVWELPPWSAGEGFRAGLGTARAPARRKGPA